MTVFDPLGFEPKILEFWEKNKIYKKQVEKGKKGKPYYYLDGPPYTSGRMHIGQAWGKALRDSVLRYKRMQGFDVFDRAGFDVHGLPTALRVQKELGIKYKEDIEKYGVDKFIEKCKEYATDKMETMIVDFKRMAAWLNWDNPYKAMDNSYIESLWFALKQAHEKGYLYEGEKVMQWCADCGTALAKHELDYQTVKDDSIFVKFPVKEKDNEYLIIWTTTPWTIPFNLAVMVHPDLDYVKAKVDNEIWIVSSGLVNVFMGLIGKKFNVLKEFKGKELEGLKYIHPFAEKAPSLKGMSENYANAHTVILSDKYVDLSAGTGLVHCAPGCGPEDQEVGAAYDLPPFNELNEHGKFKNTMGEFTGKIAKTDDNYFVKELEKEGALITTTEVEHEYAHCDRCKNLVVFRATKQWFFSNEKIKDDLVKANKNIYWVPDWGGNRWFNSWLESLADATISRQRYWGTPLPIWKCNKCKSIKVIGSLKELEKEAGKKNVPKDLHRPHIDNVKVKCDCGDEAYRVKDVFDVWLDAAAASWAALDYPHKKDLFKKYWPANFILEGKDQIRGWFNVLLSFGWMVFDKPSYKAVYMHGMINDAKGRKMSKSLGNYILPEEIIDKYGADAMRYYMISAANPGEDMKYSVEDSKIKYRNLGILWNTHTYLLNNAEFLKVNPAELKISEKDLGVEEKYILSKLNTTIEKTTELFEKYYLEQIPTVIEDLFLDLSRWYIKFIRDKLSSGTKKEKEAVVYTIYRVLLETCKLLAPITPFISEQIYQNLRDCVGTTKLKKKSVHLYDWPKANKKETDLVLEKEIDIVKDIISTLLAIREKAGRNVRWPIKKAMIVSKNPEFSDIIKKHGALIRNITNTIELETPEKIADVEIKIKADYNKIAPKFGEDVVTVVRKLAEQSQESLLRDIENANKVTLKEGKKYYEVLKSEFIIEEILPSGLEGERTAQYSAYIDLEETPDMTASGLSRELIRKIQALRKVAQLKKPDKINLCIDTDNETKNLLDKYIANIKETVSAKEVVFGSVSDKKYQDALKIKNKELKIGFDVA